MRKGETLDQEKARKEQEAFAAALAAEYPKVKDRLARLNLTIKRLQIELADDPNRHLRPCPCGRQWTRLDVCTICFGENLGTK